MNQLAQITKTLGAPTELTWPGVTLLPNYHQISYKTGSKGKLRQKLPLTSFSGGPSLNETGFDLLSRLLCMDPTQVR